MSGILYLWPGSGGVLRQGRWSFLAIALLYGFALCGMVMLNFYWSELLTGNLRRGTYVMLFILWLVLSGKSSRLEKQCHRMRLPPPADKDAMPEAQQHYLQGNWFEAECCLNILLKKNPRDIEAMLMLTTLYRHKERYEEAGNLLQELDRLEDAISWKFEIRSEKRKLMAANAKRSEKTTKPKSSESFNKKHERLEDSNDDNEYAGVSKRQIAA